MLLAAAAGAVLVAGPSRTRGLAGLLFGVGLSQAHGEFAAATAGAVARHAATMGRLFDERKAVIHRVDRLEQVLSSQYGGLPVQRIADGVAKRSSTARGALPVWFTPDHVDDGTYPREIS